MRTDDQDSLTKEMTWNFPNSGFWFLHTVAPVVIFMLGVRFAARRAPVLPLLAFRLYDMYRKR